MSNIYKLHKVCTGDAEIQKKNHWVVKKIEFSKTNRKRVVNDTPCFQMEFICDSFMEKCQNFSFFFLILFH